MKRKGKVLLSLLMALALVMQLFTVSALAEGMVSGWEGLSCAVYARDEMGQTQPVTSENEYLLENKPYSVSVGGNSIDHGAGGVTLGDLLRGDLTVTPPEGWYVSQVWLYGDDTGTVTALPLTASASSAAVSVVSDVFIARYDYDTPVFDESRLSSVSSTQSYTVGVLFERLDPNAGASITYADGSFAGDGVAQTGGAPYDDPNSVFAGWSLQFPNGSSVIVPAYSEVRAYAPATLSAVYAAKVILKAQDITVSEGTDLYTVQSMFQPEPQSILNDLSLQDVSFYTDAYEPLTAGTYAIHVGGYRLVDVRTGKPVDSTRAVVETRDGTLTVEASQQGSGDTMPDATVEPQQEIVPTYAEPVVYSVLAGNGQQWQHSGDLSFQFSAEMSKLTAVTVDNWTIDNTSYTVGYDSLTLPASYLQNLTVGEHSLALTFSDGSASASFSVAELQPTVYTINADDQGQNWVRGYSPDMGFGLNADLSRFTSVEVDGVALTEGNYGVSVENSLVGVSTLHLQNLAAGEHTMKVNLTDGYAETTFTVSEPMEYAVNSGSGETWVRGGGDLSFQTNAPAGALSSATLDGAALDAANYQSADSTVTLSAAFLTTLANGEHSLVFFYADGYAQASFTVSDPAPVVYTVTSGDGQTWVRGFSGDAAFRTDGDLTNFTGLELNGTGFDAAGYTVDAANGTVALRGEALMNMAAGTYSVTLRFTDGYAAAGFTIAEAAEYTVTSGDGQTWVRNSGTDVVFTVGADLGKLSSVLIDGTAPNTEFYTFNTADSSVTLYGSYLNELAAGEHRLSVLFADGDAVALFTVSEPDPTAVTITVNDQGWTSNGSAHELDQTAYRIEGLEDGDSLTVSLAIYDQNDNPLGTAVTAAGVYRIRGTVGEYDTAKYTVGFAGDGVLTVTAPEIKSVTVTVNDQTLTYTGAALTIDQNACTVTGLNEGDTIPVTLELLDTRGNPTASVVDAGEYLIQAKPGTYDTGKYSVTVANTGKLTVKPYALTLTPTAATFTYNGQAHTSSEVTATLLPGHSFRAGDGVTTAVYDTNSTLLAGGATAVGGYINRITAVHIVDANGVEVTANYDITRTDGTLTIVASAEKTPVTITVQNQTWVNDGTAHMLDNTKYTVTGLPGGENLTVTLTAVNQANQPVGTTPAVGNYTITASHNADANKYTVTVIPGMLSVTAPASYTPVDGDTAAKSWSKNASEGLTFRINADFNKFANEVAVDNYTLPGNYYTVASGSTVVTLTPAYLNSLTDGQHSIRVKFTDGSFNSTFAVQQPTATALTITGYNVSKAYNGQPYDMSTYGQNSYGIVGSYHLAQNGVTVAQAVNVGTYDIYVDSLRSNDTTRTYVFTVRDANGAVLTNNYQNTPLKIGTLTITGASITPVTITVKDQTLTYDGGAHTLAVTAANAANYYTVSGLQGNDTITVRLSILDQSGRALSSVTDVGSYNIKAEATGYDSGKYKVTIANQGSLTVTPYKLTLTAVSASKVYDGSTNFEKKSNVSATALLSGHRFRAGDGVKFSIYDSKGNLIQSGPVNVGTYTKKVTEVHVVDGNNREVTSNYDITRIDGTLTITASGSNSPRTGDNNNIVLWVVLLLASAALIGAVAAMLLLKKKKAAAPVKPNGTIGKKTTQAKPEEQFDVDLDLDFDLDDPEDPDDRLTRRKR